MYTLATLSLIVGASALVVPRSSYSFGLTASGGEAGTIGQLADGQNRIGGGLAAATFTISNGGIIDAAGRGCILTRKFNHIFIMWPQLTCLSICRTISMRSRR